MFLNFLKRTNNFDPSRCRQHSFTVLELVAIVTIIAIIASFLLPAVKKTVQNARRVKDRNALKQLVMAYRGYAMQKGRNISISDVESWCDGGTYLMQGVAAVLALEGILRDATVYTSPNDFRYKNATSGSGGYKKMFPPKVILDKNGGFNPQFYVPGAVASAIFPLCIEGFIGIDDMAPISTTPIFFTRGAGKGGWGKENPYGENSGGFVAFLDGNVVWFDNFGETSTQGKLVKFGSAERTNDIAETVPSNVILVEARGVGKNSN